jgi:hypothetical protein
MTINTKPANPTALLDLLKDGFFAFRKFPRHMCTEKCEREDDVINSDDDCYYLCIVIDDRFSSHGRLAIMKPYVAITPQEMVDTGDPTELYGWVDKDGNFIDNYANPIHCDDEHVVAWTKLNSNELYLRELAGVKK